MENMGIWGENDGIFVRNVGILGMNTQESMGRSSFWGEMWEFWFKLLGFSKVALHESAWELWDFCGKVGNLGGK